MTPRQDTSTARQDKTRHDMTRQDMTPRRIKEQRQSKARPHLEPSSQKSFISTGLCMTSFSLTCSTIHIKPLINKRRTV